MTAKNKITDTQIALLRSFVNQLKQKRQTLKEFKDNIGVLLETLEDLEQDILVAEELDGLILERVCVTERTAARHVEGSQCSFVTSDVAAKLDLKQETQDAISLSTFGGNTSSVKRMNTATIYLETTQEETIPIHVIIVPTIAAPLTTYTGANVRDLPHLRGLTLAHVNVDDSPFTVDILIGADHYWNVVGNELIKGPGPTAAKSKIGYLLSGPLSKSNHSENLNTSILSVVSWTGRYSARLPWRPERPPLPSNAEITKERTRSMVRRLAANPEKLHLYNDIIQEQQSRGFIKKVKDPDTTNEYGITANIEKAFLHVNLDEADRDATRFYWLSNADDPDSELIVYRIKSVMFGATSSPFILNATLNKHLTQSTDQVSIDMLRNLYVDDLASGVSDDGSAVNYYQNARNTMSPVGFNLRSWSSNSPGLQHLAAKDQVLNTSPAEKVLGILWNITSDTLGFSYRQATSIPPLSTKREALQKTAKVFDPLGLLQPVTAAAKILIQELWQEGIDWDEPLDQEWRVLAKEIGNATKLEFPRRYFTSDVCVDGNETELLVFADASQKAYGAAVYLVRGNQSSLAMAKSRVAPTRKHFTLPELELMAALTAARLASYLQEQLHVTRVTLWSDSQIVLHWLNSSKILKPFISNRIQEVKKLTSISSTAPQPKTPLICSQEG
ncbi:uncharacterized protein [Montipora foliosa]|uniref:uncharacterized protein n=1 Tax=Montipora foliosa TaxID=591990 RepID=UPI0035F166E7